MNEMLTSSYDDLYD